MSLPGARDHVVRDDRHRLPALRPRCLACGGPLDGLGEELVCWLPAVFAVEYWCDGCGEVVRRLRVIDLFD